MIKFRRTKEPEALPPPPDLIDLTIPAGEGAHLRARRYEWRLNHPFQLAGDGYLMLSGNGLWGPLPPAEAVRLAQPFRTAALLDPLPAQHDDFAPGNVVVLERAGAHHSMMNAARTIRAGLLLPDVSLAMIGSGREYEALAIWEHRHWQAGIRDHLELLIAPAPLQLHPASRPTAAQAGAN